MCVLPDTLNCGLRMRGNAGNVFRTHRLQRKPLVSDHGMHHGTCVTHVPSCMSGSLTCGGGENVPGILGACAPAILRVWQEAHSWENGRTLDFNWKPIYDLCLPCSIAYDFLGHFKYVNTYLDTLFHHCHIPNLKLIHDWIPHFVETIRVKFTVTFPEVILWNWPRFTKWIF